MEEQDIRARVRALCLAFPGAHELIENPLHSAFAVKGKKFAYYLNDHHGNGRLELTMKAPPGALDVLRDIDPERFHPPAYMARHGWVGMYLDIGEIDWEQAEALLEDAYRATAPRALLKAFEVARAGG